MQSRPSMSAVVTNGDTPEPVDDHQRIAESLAVHDYKIDFLIGSMREIKDSIQQVREGMESVSRELNGKLDKLGVDVTGIVDERIVHHEKQAALENDAKPLRWFKAKAAPHIVMVALGGALTVAGSALWSAIRQLFTLKLK